MHASRALAHPRWEDYEYEYLDGQKNRLAWLGDGQTYNEKVKAGDRKFLTLSLLGVFAGLMR